jgi:SNF2 family DNA or RNA helicase
MYEKGDLKVMLFLNPNNLNELGKVMSSYHIEKKGCLAPRADIYELNLVEVKRYFWSDNQDITELVKSFSVDGIWQKYSSLKKDFSKQKSGAALDQLLYKAMLRYYHGLFKMLLPYWASIKIYHAGINIATNKTLRQVCSCNNILPRIIFNCYKTENEEVFINILIKINEDINSLETFNRYHFLLEKENNYSVLDYSDYQIIEWFLAQKSEQYAAQPELLIQQIVSKLEAKHTVIRNDCFTENILEELPSEAIMLSELSEKYLMFTPRWYYDGTLIDGPFTPTEQHIIGHQTYIIKRNQEAESKLINFIKQSHVGFSKQNNGFYYVTFEEAKKKSWFQNFYHQLLECQIKLEGLDMLKHFRYSPHAPITTLKIVEENTNNYVLELNTKFDKEKISIHEIQKILQAGQKSILLKDNSIGIFNDDWLKDYARIIMHGSISKGLITVAKVLLLSLNPTDEKKEQIGPSIVKEDWISLWQKHTQTEDELFTMPIMLTANLRPYQSKGVEWLILLEQINAGAILADDMGLGKSLQTIAFLAYHHHLKPSGKSLIICPTSLVYNWINEFEKFCSRLKISVFQPTQHIQQQMETNDVLIISYGLLRNNTHSLAVQDWANIIVDESQNIKNINSLITKSVQLLNGKFKLALSGTPIMNNTVDLFAQMDFVNPEFLGSAGFFKSYYANPIDKNKSIQKMDELKQLTSPFILRRTKQQVATDLPEKTISVKWCDMETTQRKVYDEIKEQIVSNVLVKVNEEGLGKNTIAVLAGIQKLRMICAAPWLVADTENKSNISAKLEVLAQELLERTQQHRVLVFSQFIGVLDAVSDTFSKNYIPFYRIDGSTAMKDRQPMIDAFQKEESKQRVFLLSLKAGNAGITLTAADYVYLIDPWWNTAVENQAIDRTHRIGQTKNVFAYKLICKDSIEEKILLLQQRKTQLAEDLITEEEGFVKSLSAEDVAFLFE